MSANTPADLERIYEKRFSANLEYRDAVWKVLIADFFQPMIQPEHRVLDLGCGYGEFIRNVQSAERFAMDLNANARKHLCPGVTFLEHDCSTRWPLPDESLDVIFTSNFFEHLPDKATLGRCLDEAYRCLAPGGRLIALGPNIKYLPGEYWDFWDHYVALTEKSLAEALSTRGYRLDRVIDRFLPYTMSDGWQPPLFFLRTYLRLSPAWKFFGKQFLVIAERPAAAVR